MLAAGANNLTKTLGIVRGKDSLLRQRQLGDREMNPDIHGSVIFKAVYISIGNRVHFSRLYIASLYIENAEIHHGRSEAGHQLEIQRIQSSRLFNYKLAKKNAGICSLSSLKDQKCTGQSQDSHTHTNFYVNKKYVTKH